MKMSTVLAFLLLALFLAPASAQAQEAVPPGLTGLTPLAWGPAGGAAAAPPAWERWVLPPLAGLAGGLAANTVFGVGVYAAVAVFSPLLLPILVAARTSLTAVLNATLLITATLVAPLFTSLGVLAYGQSIGRRGTLTTLLLSYAGAAAGAALYLAGYPQLGTYLLLAAPVVGAVAGFWLWNRPLERVELPFAASPLLDAARRIGGGLLGGLVGELLYLSARYQIPLLESDRADLATLVAGTFAGGPLDWIAAIPLACSTGVILANRFQSRSGSLLLTLAAGAAGSLAGWGVSALAGSDSTIPALLLTLLSSVTVALLSEPRGVEAAPRVAAAPALKLALLPARAPAMGLRVSW